MRKKEEGGREGGGGGKIGKLLCLLLCLHAPSSLRWSLNVKKMKDTYCTQLKISD